MEVPVTWIFILSILSWGGFDTIVKLLFSFLNESKLLTALMLSSSPFVLLIDLLRLIVSNKVSFLNDPCSLFFLVLWPAIIWKSMLDLDPFSSLVLLLLFLILASCKSVNLRFPTGASTDSLSSMYSAYPLLFIRAATFVLKSYLFSPCNFPGPPFPSSSLSWTFSHISILAWLLSLMISAMSEYS